jgi:signal transduction histidine kinase
MQARIFTKTNGLEYRKTAGFKTKISLLLIVIGFCLFTYGCSTRHDIDLISMNKNDLEELLHKTPESTLKVDIFNELAYRDSWNGGNGGKKPLDYVNSAMRMAENITYTRGIVDAWCISGHIYFLKGEFDNSKTRYEKGMELAKRIKYRTGKAMAYTGIGRYFQVRGEFARGLENFLQSEAICKNSSNKIDKRVLARAYYGIGALYYYDPQDYQEAMKYFEEHLKLGLEIEDNIIITSGYYSIGVMYQVLKNYEKAKKYLEDCLTLSKKIGLIYNDANASEGLGDVHFDQDNYEEALKKYEKSHELFLGTRNKFQVAEIKRRLGKLYNKMGERDNKIENFKKAFKYLHDALYLAQDANIPKTIEGVCEEIIKACEKLGEYQTASNYYQLLLDTKAFLRKNEMSRLKLKYDLEKKTEKERITRYSLIIGFIVLSTVLVVVLRNFLILRKQKKSLEVYYKNVERMSDIGKAVTSSLSANEIIDRVYENVNKLMDAEGFYIGIYNEKEQRLELPGGKEFGKGMRFHYNDLSEKNRLSVHCFDNEVEIRIGDYSKEYHKHISEILPPKVGNTFKSYIFLPLVLRDKLGRKKKIGVIIVQSNKINAYSDYQYNILKNLAIYVAIALDNANAYKKIEEQKAKIEEQADILAVQTVKLVEALEKEKEISDHKDELMYTVSHQYKTPLSIIDSSTQILKDYLPKLSGKEIAEHFNKILSNLEKMSHLIDQLLMFGKKFTPAYYDPGTICRDFTEDIKSNEGIKHNIEFKSSGDCVKVKMDKDFMNIMLRNLLLNSIKYSPEGSKISVELLCDEKYAVIKVLDNGIGIPEDYLKMPFERFHRGSNVGAFPGTGLGLSIVKRYTELHGGTISIESKLDAGTTVTIKIPKDS